LKKLPGRCVCCIPQAKCGTDCVYHFI